MKHKVIVLLILLSAVLLNGCNGCSRSKIHRIRQDANKRTEDSRKVIRRHQHQENSRNIVKMKEENGIYKVPVEVNGVKMFFIFDTGASLISISETEALFLLKQGTISKNDVLGEVKFSDANGDISAGTIIRLKTVKLGNKTLHNIEASVVHNNVAPLLLGQSALAKFGKVSIDYNKGIIIFGD